MKRLLLLVMIGLIGLTVVNVEAKTRRVKRKANVASNVIKNVPIVDLVDVIATGSHWKERNLAKLGLKKLAKKTMREEYGTSVLYVYGNNAQATVDSNWETTVTATGANAYAIELALTTDNSTTVYIKDEADYEAFMSCMKQSGYYNDSDENFILLGQSSIVSDECNDDGWHVITFHAD